MKTYWFAYRDDNTANLKQTATKALVYMQEGSQ